MHTSLPSFVSNPNPDIYLGSNYLVLDVETTNREHGSALDGQNTLILACWRLGNGHPDASRGRDYAVWSDEFGQSDLLAACARADFIVAHHSKFEGGWLRRCGLNLRKILPYDTMIGEKVLAGNRKQSLSLDATAARRGLGSKSAVAASLIKAGVCPTQIPQSMLQEYCEQDVALTESIFLQQRDELAALSLLPVAYCRNLVTPALADIEFNGMTLAPERVQETYRDYATKYAHLEEEFSKVTGGINVKSSKQMAEFIYGGLAFEEPTDYRGQILKTAAGKPKTDKETIANLKAYTPEQKAFLKVTRELIKFKTPLQNLTKMYDICRESPDDPRVFASYNQTVTKTDRLSSTSRNGGFQFQNFDRAFKKLFKARKPGHVICEADAPQLEFRVAAMLGNDEVAKRDILDGVDIHANTASVLGSNRQDAKSKTFRPLYGGNNGTPREKAYFKYFRDRYAGIYEAQSAWCVEVAKNKQLITPWGLRFYWPDTEITKSGYITNSTQIFNAPIQSFATADIIPLTFVLLWHRVAEFGDDCTLVNTIHDSIIAEILRAIERAYKQVVVECFTHDIYELVEKIYGIAIDVPLGVGIKVGEHWGEGDEEKYEPGVKKD